ncbi:MAG: type II and III secretion system protein family protein [Alsobacter sp.]
MTSRISGHASRWGLMLGAAALAVSGLAAPPVLAQSANGQLAISSGEAGMVRKIDLGIGKSVIVDLPRDAKEVFVANPKVANAVVRSTRKIFVIGQADGQTNVVVMDAEGRQIANLDINIGRDLNVLRRTIKAAMPNSQVNVVAVGDTIVLTGSVANAGDALQAMDIAKGFVGTSAVGQGAITGNVVNSITVRGKDQVMLKVTVSEVQRVVLKQLGINSYGTWQVGDIAGNVLFDNPFALSRTVLSNSAISGSIGNSTSSKMTLQAAERNGLLRTLAEPTLTAISGEAAKFSAGGKVPVPSGVSCTSGTFGASVCLPSIEYKDIGVALNFTPIVLSEGRISLHVSTEVTDIDSNNQLQYSNVTAPAFKTRKMDTTVELPSGASLVSAGLIQQQSGQIINGFPALLNLPILGALFRSRDYQRNETELLITVTPYIARPSSPNAVARPDDGFVDASDPQAVLLGRFNKIYGQPSPRPPATSAYRGNAGFIIE